MSVSKGSRKQSAGVPNQTAPTPPATYAANGGKRGRHRNPLANEVSNAAAAADEITASRTYSDDFGATAPSATALGALLANAGAWSQKQSEANLWQGYVQDGTNAAWRAAFVGLDGMAVKFDAATKLDPSIVDRYPHLAKVLAATTERARVGASTRASNKRKGIEAAKEQSKAVAVTSSPEGATTEK